MKYTNLKYPGVNISLSTFDGNRSEGHAIITSDHGGDAATQIAEITRAAESLVSDTGLKPVFKRYLLSDASGQWSLLPEKEECARCLLQQSPLDGTKGALLMLMEKDADFKDVGDGLWKDSRGRIWAGDMDSVIPEYSQTMTIDYLERFSHRLEEYGANLLDHCIRTWFFVRDIDNNYAGVVSGRNAVFKRRGLTPETHFIASTGIAGQSPVPGRSVTFNAFADTKVKRDQVKFIYGKTHLNPTYEYGVAFERGTSVDYGDRRHVYISGTASIDNKGQIVAPGDIRAQTLRMIENIRVLLEEAECGWEDVAHMVVYLRDISDYNTVDGMMRERFPDIPKVIVLAPVCRTGWLIETECMAIRPCRHSCYEPY